MNTEVNMRICPLSEEMYIRNIPSLKGSTLTPGLAAIDTQEEELQKNPTTQEKITQLREKDRLQAGGLEKSASILSIGFGSWSAISTGILLVTGAVPGIGTAVLFTATAISGYLTAGGHYKVREITAEEKGRGLAAERINRVKEKITTISSRIFEHENPEQSEKAITGLTAVVKKYAEKEETASWIHDPFYKHDTIFRKEGTSKNGWKGEDRGETYSVSSLKTERAWCASGQRETTYLVTTTYHKTHMSRYDASIVTPYPPEA